MGKESPCGAFFGQITDEVGYAARDDRTGSLGVNMVRRLQRGGHQCVAFDQRKPETAKAIEADGAKGFSTLKEFVAALEAPRSTWIMRAGQRKRPPTPVPATLRPMPQPGDTIIDGANLHYQDDIRRAKEEEGRRHSLHGARPSGGVLGLERGYRLMGGGPKEDFARLEPIFATLSPGAGKGGSPAQGRVISTAAITVRATA